jgi:hypothetical protein
VSDNLDDAEERANGGVALGSGDLELVFDKGGNQTVGLRLNEVTIPQGATIIDAYLQFTVDETYSPPDTSLTIQAEAVDNAAPFTSADFNISSRTTTGAAVGWSPPTWDTVGAAGPAQQTGDIAPVIQEIVNRPGWTSGNSLAIIITGSGERIAESHNGGSTVAPLLHVEYVVGN